MNLTSLLRDVFNIDPRWSRNGNDIVWTDGAYTQVYFNPWKKILAPNKRTTLKISWLTKLLLPQTPTSSARSQRTPGIVLLNSPAHGEFVYGATKPNELRFL
jgi:hypothetical protein